MNSVFHFNCCKNPIKDIGMLSRRVKWAWQRVTKGFCDADVWSIDWWFLSVMPDMLASLKENHTGYPGVLMEDYYNAHKEELNMTREAFMYASSDKTPEMGAIREEARKACDAQWSSILAEMIFLLREAMDETCTRRNPFEEEHDRISEEFKKKYGFFGEALATAEEKSRDPALGVRMYFPSDLPEYKDAEERYHEEFRKIADYQNECKNQALALFAKWFYNLWD